MVCKSKDPPYTITSLLEISWLSLKCLHQHRQPTFALLVPYLYKGRVGTWHKLDLCFSCLSVSKQYVTVNVCFLRYCLNYFSLIMKINHLPFDYEE